MNRWLARLRSENAPRYALACAAGVVLGFAFPKFSVAGLAWIGPGFLLFAAAGTSGKFAFRTGFAGGFAFHLFTLYWLLHIPVPVAPFFGWVALSAYCALYPAVWSWLCWRTFPGRRSTAARPWAPEVLNALRETRWSRRMLWALQCAAIWVALEMVLARFLSGFPWEFLGVSQYRMLPVIQISAFTGVYGVSFLIVWCSVSLMLGALFLTGRQRHIWAREIAPAFLAAAAAVAFGLGTIREPIPRDRTVRAALIQPSIPQTLIWDERENASRFRRLMKLSEDALTNNVQLLIWPEAAVPNMLRHDPGIRNAVTGLTRSRQVWAILGSDDAEYRPDTNERVIDYFNSAFAVSPRGELAARYIKRQLVIFGEYMPFSEWLPFLKRISPAGEGFTAGKRAAAFTLSDLDARAAILICFEDTFPHLVREYVRADTDFLVNLTNNGWFGESAAQWQHAAAAVFRAVENRIPLVRCANNGLTCWVDERGATSNIYFPASENIYQAGFKIVEVPLLGANASRELTFYTRQGDVFGWVCVAWFGAILARLAFRARTAQKSKGSS